MKRALYWMFILALAPMQATLLHYIGLGGVRPDIVLVSVCLIGFFRGELEGFVVGLLLGFTQDVFSAGDLWLNLMTKGGIGLVAGLAGRQVAHVTVPVMLTGLFIVSCCSSLIFLFLTQTGGLSGMGLAVRSILVPQALFDALLGAGAYWFLEARVQGQWALAE